MKLPLSALVVLVGYVVAITAFGTWLGRRRRSVRDYFLAGRSVPWWAIAACIVATETSTLTFIGVPGTAYRGDWTFLQLVLRLHHRAAAHRGALHPRLLPRRDLHLVRAAAAALRRRACARVSAGDLPPLPHPRRRHPPARGRPRAGRGRRASRNGGASSLLGVAMILYTEEGGVVATIWTDAIQMFVYLAGAHRLPGRGHPPPARAGWARPWPPPPPRASCALIDFSFDLRQPFTLWAGVIGGAFLTLATHGTDHYLVQRLLVARSQKRRLAGPRALRLPGPGPVRAVPVPGHAPLGPLRGPRLRARRRGAADLRLHRARPAAGPGSSWPPSWRPRSRPRSTRWPRRPCATSTCPTSGRTPREAQQMRVGRAFTVVWGIAQIVVAVRGPGHGLGAAGGPGRARLRVRAHGGRVPARRAHAPGDVDGDDDRDDRGAGDEPCRRNAVAPTSSTRPGVAWTWNVAVGATASRSRWP